MTTPLETHSPQRFEAADDDPRQEFRGREEVIDHQASSRSTESSCSWTLLNGAKVTSRPIGPADAPLLGDMVQRLSRRSRYKRFDGTLNGLSSATLKKLTNLEHARDAALVVTAVSGHREVMVAEARYAIDGTGCGAEFTIIVDDQWQGYGIGYRAMKSLAQIAEMRGLRWLYGTFRNDNASMLSLMRRCSFLCTIERNDEMIMRAEKHICSTAPAMNTSPSRLRAPKWLAATFIPDFM